MISLRRYFHLFFILSAVFLFGSCGQETSIYTNKTYGIQLTYPSNWEPKENINGTVVTLMAPKESKIDAFQENFNLIVQDLSNKPISLPEYSNMAINQLKGMYNNVEIVDTSSIVIASRPGTKIEYLLKAENKFKLIQAWMLKDKKAYLMTFSADADRFDEYKPKVMRIIKSLTVK